MARAQALARKQAARDFAKRWKGRGYEKGDTASFWLELLRDVVGMEDVTTSVRFENQTVERGYIDVTIRDAKTVIEQKSLGVDLDKPELRQGTLVTPFEQAKRYADSLRNSERPDTIIVCDFNEFRIHDLDTDKPAENYERFTLDELPEQLHLLEFLVDPQMARRKREEKVSLDAGMLIGELYDKIRAQYRDPDAEASMHALNVLCVRLVFLLFAEDAGLMKKDAFFRYLKPVPPNMVRTALMQLFDWLNTPVDQRDPYASDALKEFPYVNGGLFMDKVEVPNFTEEIVDFLLNKVSLDTDWSQISPTVFGGVFESTLNPETRRKGGMHYTSPKNIHKVIGPLFLDDLKAELAYILTTGDYGERKRRFELQRFHDKIAGLRFFDPACGSGNFLTETYIQLRRLENKVLSELQRNQSSIAFSEEVTPLKVSLRQFHGIEINAFAVNVASTALWIAQLQANAEAQSIVYSLIEDLPLEDSAHIIHGNALTVPWEEVLDPAECDYIIGNPPFVGARNQSKKQKAELKTVFQGAKNAGNIDYVGAWFMKAARYIGDEKVRCAFVATNSICQGEQVANLWSPIYDLGVRIDFAHDTFRWTSKSTGQAAVFVIIVGFSKLGGPKRLYHYVTADAEPVVEYPVQLNVYLKDAPDVFVWDRSAPLCDVPAMTIGSQPIDDGNYLFKPDEKAEFLAKEPGAERFFKRWYGSREFIHGTERWVLWLGEATWAELSKLPECMKRVQAVREFRLMSRRAQTLKAAARPQHFGTEIIHTTSAIIVPETSSEARRYIPMGFIGAEAMASNAVRLIPDATKYHFGILQSRMHNAWMRTVGGRLKSDYRYANTVVYNTFVWPEVDETQRAQIEAAGQAVLDARAQYPDATLEDLYDPDNAWMFPVLMKAHAELDAAVERAYGLTPGLDEKEIVAHLFELHAEAVGRAQTRATRHRPARDAARGTG